MSTEEQLCRHCETTLVMGVCPHACAAVLAAFAAKSIEEFKSYAQGERELFAPEVR